MKAFELKTNPNLLAQMHRSRSLKPSPDDLYLQRLSFIHSSLGKHNTITIAEIDAQLKRQEGR